jgi:DNA-directed RNA polymerase subunit RPC12/RpoP
MLKYNIQDIHLLDAVYRKIRHYDTKHPNVGQYYRDGKRRCTVCGSAAVVLTGGESHTQLSIFQEARCEYCGHHMRVPGTLKTKQEKLVAVANA